MRSLKADKEGSLRSLATTIVLLIIIAYAFSVLYPQEWTRILDWIRTVWNLVPNWLDQGWETLKGWFDRYLPFLALANLLRWSLVRT